MFFFKKKRKINTMLHTCLNTFTIKIEQENIDSPYI